MSNWFKNLFGPKPIEYAYRPTMLREKGSLNLEQPEEKVAVEIVPPVPSYPEGVSEPVISFVEAVRKCPRRFRVKSLHNEEPRQFIHKDYVICDKKENISFRVWASCSPATGKITYRGLNVGCFTQEELEYAMKEVYNIYSDRFHRYLELRNQRARRKYMKIYGEDK